MRKIITTTYVTFDGVMQSNGGPEKDRDGASAYGGWVNGFAYAGWMMKYWDQMMWNTFDKLMELPFELLLGKRTYDVFAAYWPHDTTSPKIAVPFNTTRKYVVSHSPAELSWQNSSLITGDVITEIKKLKNMDGPDLWVHGSGRLISTLLANDLIDQMLVWTFPLTIGSGQRLFPQGTPPVEFKFVDSRTFPTGVVITTYEPSAPLKTGAL